MDRKHNVNLRNNARKLRKEMTKEERRLWYDFLRGYPVKFNRQKILGKYKNIELPIKELVFNYTDDKTHKISILENLVN